MVEGLPSHVHGGAVAAVLDEATGAVAWMNGHAVVMVRLTVKFCKMVPLGTDATLEAWIDHVKGRQVSVRATLDDEAGCRLAESDGLCVELLPEQLESLNLTSRSK